MPCSMEIFVTNNILVCLEQWSISINHMLSKMSSFKYIKNSSSVIPQFSNSTIECLSDSLFLEIVYLFLPCLWHLTNGKTIYQLKLRFMKQKHKKLSTFLVTRTQGVKMSQRIMKIVHNHPKTLVSKFCKFYICQTSLTLTCFIRLSFWLV